MVGFTLSALPALVLSLSAVASPARLAKRDNPVPSFVLANAPVSHLYSKEQWWPADVAVHLTHVTPEVNLSTVATSVTFQNISSLGSDVCLTSKDDVSKSPAWLNSAVGKPDANGLSTAPTTIILVNKPGDILDAFYFYFYSYDHGGKVLDIEFGDHVGDWEHSMVRFVNGTPSAIYLSAHSGGSAYTFNATQKTNGRPTTYIGVGTHANYAQSGSHCHDLPANLLCDQTDAGPLWDPAASYRAFWFDNSTQTFTVAGGAGVGAANIKAEGTDWLSYKGRWGDEQYSDFDHGQYCIEIGSLVNECKYVTGPTGPIAKNLGRTAVCQTESGCKISTSL